MSDRKSRNPAFRAMVSEEKKGCLGILPSWVKVFSIIPEFQILRLTFHRKSLKIVSMIRNHNHKPQTTQWHCEEEPLNHHETPGRQIKQINTTSSLFLKILNQKLFNSFSDLFSVHFWAIGHLHLKMVTLCRHAASFKI